MMTEAGIVGKIRVNPAGVGVALNAVRAKGVDFARLPVHLELRRVLESDSCGEAVQVLEKVGVATACHVLIADLSGSAGLECTAFDVVRLGTWKQQGVQMGSEFTTHTNHFIPSHSEPNGPPDLPDSPFRLARVNELLEKETRRPTFERIDEMLKDEANSPGST
jgi:isopenicillin-N N-acyltransferase like protein